jgi:hypothetical protein
MDPTDAATAVWLVMAMFVRKPTMQPPGTSSHLMRRMGAMSSRTISRSAPMARKMKAYPIAEQIGPMVLLFAISRRNSSRIAQGFSATTPRASPAAKSARRTSTRFTTR